MSDHHPPRLMTGRILLACLPLAAVTALWVGREPAREGSATLGFELGAPEQEFEHQAFRSPAGRVVRYDEVDPLGYRLPLDLGSDPDREATESRAMIKPPAERMAPLGSLFEEHRLNADDGHTQNETSIAVDGSVLVAGWNNYTATTLVMGVGRSTDGGHSWSTFNFGSFSATSDPAVRAGGGGRWYYACLASGGQFGGSDYDIFVRRSTDDAATWSNPVDATQNGGFDDKPYIDARGSEVLLGWADFSFSPAKIRTVRSTDGGVTFGANHVLANHSVGGNGACPVIAPNGAYYVFWRDSFQDSLWVSRSTDQGANWSIDRGIVPMNPLPSTLPGGFRIVNLPSADADPVTGDLVVVWNDQAFGNADILSIRSTDQGTTWSAPIRVNDDAGTTAQFFPWVTFDPSGVAHCVWYDRRQNGSLIDVYYARSLDRGVTWEANVRVTGSGFVPVLPWDTSVDFIGDYNGITATSDTAYPFYQDSRAGNQDVYVSLIPSAPVAVEDGPSPLAATLRASPNPFRATTRIVRANRGSRAAPGELRIYDSDGREIRRLFEAPSGGWDWDGRDDKGREVPAGAYFLRPPGRSAESTRVVRLR